MDSFSRRQRLENVLGWLQTAKENLPAINNNAVSSDQIASMSALVDRMQRVARALQTASRSQPERRAA
jgi:hypothetical protein